MAAGGVDPLDHGTQNARMRTRWWLEGTRGAGVIAAALALAFWASSCSSSDSSSDKSESKADSTSAKGDGTEQSGSGQNGSGATNSGPSGSSKPTASGQAKADGWEGSLQFLGKGPNGYDNGKKSACTGAGAGSPSVLCVKAGGNGKGTAAAPFGSINSALAAGKAGDIVQVAGGKYSENVLVGKFNDPASTEVNLLGGFSDDFSSRDASKFRSVIDGKGSNPGLQLHLQSKGKSVIDGFRITNGRGLGNNSENGNGRGGGIYLEMIGGGEVLISHNEVFGNKANGKEDEARGGGIFTSAADYDGSKSTIRIEDNVVHSNEAGRGAGITVTGRHAIILRNMVEANKSHSDHGGGVYVSTANTEVTDNVVRGNEVGATVKYGYGYGGGIIMAGAPATLRGNIFTGNYAPTNGSAVFWDEGAKGTMTEDLLFANACPSEPRDGVALYVDGGAGPSVVTLDHVTIANHNCPDAAPNGAAVFVEDKSSVTVKNSIIWGALKDFATNLNGKYTISNSVTNESGSGNKKGDPQFVDPEKGDFHLKQGSPAIGAASDKSNLGAYPK